MDTIVDFIAIGAIVSVSVWVIVGILTLAGTLGKVDDGTPRMNEYGLQSFNRQTWEYGDCEVEPITVLLTKEESEEMRRSRRLTYDAMCVIADPLAGLTPYKKKDG